MWNVAHGPTCGCVDAAAGVALCGCAAQLLRFAHLFHINWLAPGAEPHWCFWAEETMNTIIHLLNPVQHKPLTVTSNTSVCLFHYFIGVIYPHKLSFAYLSASALHHVAYLNIWPAIIPGLNRWTRELRTGMTKSIFFLCFFKVREGQRRPGIPGKKKPSACSHRCQHLCSNVARCSQQRNRDSSVSLTDALVPGGACGLFTGTFILLWLNVV